MSDIDKWYESVRLHFASEPKKVSKSKVGSAYDSNNARMIPNPAYDKPYMEVYASEAYKDYHQASNDIDKILGNMEIEGAKCPRCGKNTLVRKSVQRRSADEGESTIIHCLNEGCSYKSSEN